MKMKQHHSPDPLAGWSGTSVHIMFFLTLLVILGALTLVVTCIYFVCVRPTRSAEGRGYISRFLRWLGLDKQNTIDYRLDQQLITEVFRELPFLITPVSLRTQYEKQKLVWKYIHVKLLNNKAVNGGGQHINSGNFDVEIMKERFQKCLPGILADSKNEYILQKHPYVFAYDDYLSIIEETLAEKFEFKDNRENQVREGSSRSTANTFSAAYVASRDTDRDSTVSFEFDAEDAKLEDPIEYELSNGTDTVKPETRAKLLHLKTNMQILELISRTIKFQDNTPAIKWSNKAVSTFLRNMVMESMKTNEYELSELAHRLREALNGSDDELSGNGREYEMRTLV